MSSAVRVRFLGPSRRMNTRSYLHIAPGAAWKRKMVPVPYSTSLPSCKNDSSHSDRRNGLPGVYVGCKVTQRCLPQARLVALVVACVQHLVFATSIIRLHFPVGYGTITTWAI